MGIFNDEWENEVYRLKAQIRELEKENKSLREQLAKQETLENELAIVRANLVQVEMQRDTFAMKLAIYGVRPNLKPWDNKEVE